MAAIAAASAEIPTAVQADLAPVMAFAPFGRAEGPALAETMVQDAVPVDLTLLGITLSADARASHAMIAAADGIAHSLGIGQRLPSGAVLVRVAADHVVMQSGDAETRLDFPADRASPSAPALPAPAGGPDLGNLIPAAAIASPPPDPGLAPASRSLLTGIRLAMRHDPAGYVRGLGLGPDANGYRVQANPDPALLQAGLQADDVVTLVNGIPPGDPARDAAILDAVASAGTALLQVDRDGQNLTLTVPLE